jgi:cytochrome c biogenesis protein CcdA
MSFIFSVLVSIGFSTDYVVIEYFYRSFDESCPECVDPDMNRVNNVVKQIELKYGKEVVVRWLDMWTSEGRERWNFYNLGIFRPTVVINGTLVLKDTPEEPITEERLSEAIDSYLGKANSNPFKSVIKSFRLMASSEIFLAFSMGFYSGFSPCLMAMLAFILSYSVSASEGLIGALGRTLAFGMGLITAIIIVGIVVLSLGAPLYPLITYLHNITLMTSILMIFVGLGLVGLLKLPISIKPFVQGLARKYGYSLLGLFLFGIFFFFIKVPCAFPLFILLLSQIAVGATLIDLSLFWAFSLGLLIPFLGIGIVSGGTPKLAKGIRERYRFKIRTLSGIILIIYALWLIWQTISQKFYGF